MSVKTLHLEYETVQFYYTVRPHATGVPSVVAMLFKIVPAASVSVQADFELAPL